MHVAAIEERKRRLGKRRLGRGDRGHQERGRRVNSNVATSQSISPLVESNNKLAVLNHDKCIVLNDYFAYH